MDAIKDALKDAIARPDAVLMAALALPGLALAQVQPPEQASLSVKYLDYQDWQPGLDRIGVHSPAVELVVPFAGAWSVRGSMVSDTISGASPRYHTAVSGASHFNEKRNAGDVEVTRYFPRASVSLDVGRSNENDYLSKFASVRAAFASDDNNRTWTFGVGVANDTINPVNLLVRDERKHTVDLMAGLTQVLTPRDLGQVVVTHTRGEGYFTMPYKYVDNRPRSQDKSTVLLRWNHYFSSSGMTSRASYRFYTDSWGIRAHTLEEQLVRPLGDGWKVTPLVRLYTQSAARFYFDPGYDTRFGPPFPPGYSFTDGREISADQRLSAFGAVTLGLKVEKEIGKNTTVDVSLERYRQQSAWRLFGGGSPGLQRFDARSIVVGITTRW
ncbi:DUF3570 domain-containing protein [Zemynaea arenosa]|nr:DUF3570 domain-containing protein [Massilia arenosa]